MQDVRNNTGLLLQPGVIDIFLKAANGNPPQHAYSLCNLIGDSVYLFVLRIEQDMQLNEPAPLTFQ